jgi:hypothetical protein
MADENDDKKIQDPETDKQAPMAWDIEDDTGTRRITQDDILKADQHKQEVERLTREKAELLARHAKLVSSVGLQQSEAGKFRKENPKPEEPEDPFENVDFDEPEEVKATISKLQKDNKALKDDISKQVDQKFFENQALAIISDHPVLSKLPINAAKTTFDSAVEFANEQNRIAQAKGEPFPFPTHKAAIDGYMKAIAEGLKPIETKPDESKDKNTPAGDKTVKITQQLFKDVTKGGEATVPAGGGGVSEETELVAKWGSMSITEQDAVIKGMKDHERASFQRNLNKYLEKHPG